MTQYVIDLASYQAGIDLDAVKAAGFDAVNIKLGQGSGYTWANLVSGKHTNDAWSYAAAAERLGLGRCGFYWIDNTASGGAQAGRALSTARSVFGTALDGVAFQCDNESSATWAITRDFINAMQDGAGRHIAVYTGDWWAGASGRASWNVAALTPYLWAAPNSGYLSSYPGDSSGHWAAGYWGYSNLALMQYAVSPIAGVGISGNVSKTAVRDPAVWAALTQGDDVALNADTDYPAFKKLMEKFLAEPEWADVPDWNGAKATRSMKWMLGSARANAFDTHKLVAAQDPAALAAALKAAGVGDAVSQADLEAALRTVLGSLDDAAASGQ